MNEYDKQASDFKKLTGTRISCLGGSNKTGFFGKDDKDTRMVVRFRMYNSRGEYSFEFGMSIADTREFKDKPTSYDALACLTKYDPGTFEDFCSDYGYNDDSREAERIYKVVVREWKAVRELYNDDELEVLRGIE